MLIFSAYTNLSEMTPSCVHIWRWQRIFIAHDAWVVTFFLNCVC